MHTNNMCVVFMSILVATPPSHFELLKPPLINSNNIMKPYDWYQDQQRRFPFTQNPPHTIILALWIEPPKIPCHSSLVNI